MSSCINDTKDIIKRLMVEKKNGTEQLYVKIPVFMRTRLSDLIDSIKWIEISEGCAMGNQVYMQLAQEKYNEVIAHMNRYIEICKKKSYETDTDNILFMTADANCVRNEYGNDAAKFAKEMANCIQMEKELITEYFKFVTTEAPLLWPQCYLENQPAASQPAMDLAQQENVEMDLENSVDPLFAELEKLIDEAESLFKAATTPQADVSESSLSFMDELGQFPVDSEMFARILESATVQSNPLDERKIVNMIVERLERISSHAEVSLKKLKNLVVEWMNAQAKNSVGVGPNLSLKDLSNNFESFGKSLNKVLEMLEGGGSNGLFYEEVPMLQATNVPSFLHIHQKFKTFEESFFQFNLVVDTQPKDLMSIESAGKKDREDSAAASSATETSKRQKNYCTKKNQNIETSVSFLGAEFFPAVMIKGARIELVSEKELASPPQPQTGKERKPKLDFKTQIDNSNFSVKFSEVAVKNFSRIEQNTVYKQFFRIQYFVDVEVNGAKYSIKMLSLPFMFHTGSNQILELIGARMWYIANVQDMYNGSFSCPDSLDVNQVLDMLNDRVTYLNRKQRGLTTAERDFLRKRLPVATGDKVTMQGFIKDKMKKSRNSEELPYSFHTWFHAVLHSIQEYLCDAWKDGIIYGFCSESTTKALLMRSDIKPGTFILRPSISNDIKNMSSKEATAAITMDIRLVNDEATEACLMEQVQSVPIFIKTIHKNSLHGAITGILKNEKPIAKYVYTSSTDIKPVSCLKRYKSKTDSTNQLFKDYKLVMNKVENFSIRTTDDSVQGGRSTDQNQDDLHRRGSGPSMRKRRMLSTQSSTGSSPGHGRSTQPMSRSASREESNLPPFHDLTSHELNQEPQAVGMFPVIPRPMPTQGQRLGHQSNSVPETHNQLQGFNECGSFVSFRGIHVDTSNIASLPVSNNNPCMPSVAEMSLSLIHETTIHNQLLGSQLFELHQEGFPNTVSRMDSFTPSTSTASPESWRSESSPDNLPTVLDEAIELSLEAQGLSNINSGNRNRNGLSMNDHIRNLSSIHRAANQQVDPWGSPNDSGIDGDEMPSPDPVPANRLF